MVRLVSVVTKGRGGVFKIMFFCGIGILMGYVYHTLVPFFTTRYFVEQGRVRATILPIGVPELTITSVVIGLGQLVLNRRTSNMGATICTI